MENQTEKMVLDANTVLNTDCTWSLGYREDGITKFLTIDNVFYQYINNLRFKTEEEALTYVHFLRDNIDS